MNPKSFMLIAGDPSGDLLAAELVSALKHGATPNPSAGLSLEFFGAGGPKMAAAGVTLAFDLTQHSIIGLLEALKHYSKFKKLFDQLVQLAVQRKPDVIVCVDFSGFNRRFAHAIKNLVRERKVSADWNPRIVQYVSPQVWASRPGRAEKMARDFDLLLAIFPFEKEWYARHAPTLRVKFVGHPILDRHAHEASTEDSPRAPHSPTSPLILLLPGSRLGELKRHLLVMISAAQKIYARHPEARFKIVLPSEDLKAFARRLIGELQIEIQVGGLAESLRGAAIAIASTGTVTMECAYFGVPTVAIYKTSWSSYQIGKRIIQVKYLAMPNLLAGESIFPELIQQEATPENISREVMSLWHDDQRRLAMKEKLAGIIRLLGEPGASVRAAAAIYSLP